MEQFIHFVTELDPAWVYAAIFFIAFIENIFPPSPSDAVVVFGGSLVALEKGFFFMALSAATVGSTLGFITMFLIGRWFGVRVVESGRLKFISLEAVHKAEQWFARYGYRLVIANRFLAGTRAIVSFFAGMSNLVFSKTVVLSFVSALVWNSILVYAGYVLGKNWYRIEIYLTTYGQVVTGIVILTVLFFVGRYFVRHRNGEKKNG